MYQHLHRPQCHWLFSLVLRPVLVDQGHVLCLKLMPLSLAITVNGWGYISIIMSSPVIFALILGMRHTDGLNMLEENGGKLRVRHVAKQHNLMQPETEVMVHIDKLNKGARR